MISLVIRQLVMFQNNGLVIPRWFGTKSPHSKYSHDFDWNLIRINSLIFKIHMGFVVCNLRPKPWQLGIHNLFITHTIHGPIVYLPTNFP